jgi:hypothetical protein
LATETALTLGLVFGLHLRQTERLLRIPDQQTENGEAATVWAGENQSPSSSPYRAIMIKGHRKCI